MTTAKVPARPKQKHNKRNLVFLVWPSNNCQIDQQRKVPEGVTLHLNSGVWVFRGLSFKIGRSARSLFHEQKGVPLGCFDLTIASHRAEFQDTIEWVAKRHGDPGD